MPSLKRPRGIAAELWRAAKDASKQLARAGLEHRLIGGLAVAVHGYVRATRDVDFLLDGEAFIEHENGIVTLHPAVPSAVRGETIDAIPLYGSEIDAGIFDEAGIDVDGIPVAPIAIVIYLKLRAGRRRDLHDIRELIAAGCNTEIIDDWLREQDPALADRFIELVNEIDGADQ